MLNHEICQSTDRLNGLPWFLFLSNKTNKQQHTQNIQQKKLFQYLFSIGAAQLWLFVAGKHAIWLSLQCIWKQQQHKSQSQQQYSRKQHGHHGNRWVANPFE